MLPYLFTSLPLLSSSLIIPKVLEHHLLNSKSSANKLPHERYWGTLDYKSRISEIPQISPCLTQCYWWRNKISGAIWSHIIVYKKNRWPKKSAGMQWSALKNGVWSVSVGRFKKVLGKKLSFIFVNELTLPLTWQWVIFNALISLGNLTSSFGPRPILLISLKIID